MSSELIGCFGVTCRLAGAKLNRNIDSLIDPFKSLPALMGRIQFVIGKAA